MSYLKITDIDQEKSLTKSEAESIVGGWGFSWRPKRSSKYRPEPVVDQTGAYIPQAIVAVSQGNNGAGVSNGPGKGQDNNSAININF